MPAHGWSPRGGIARPERHGTGREPDLDVGRRRRDAVARRQVDGVGQERAGAPPERVAVRVLGDHEADERVGVAVGRAEPDGRCRTDEQCCDRHESEQARERGADRANTHALDLHS